MSSGLDYTIKTSPESQNIRVSWLLCHKPKGLLALVNGNLGG
jgi:hypothetical protein